MQTAPGMEGHPGCGGNRQPPSSEAAGVCCQSVSQESVLSVQHRGHRTGESFVLRIPVGNVSTRLLCTC